MFKERYGYHLVYITVLLLLPSKLFSIGLKTACDLLNLPRECQCQKIRATSINSVNQTRIRCRQLTEINVDHRWSSVSYDQLVFETVNDNLTLHRFAFSDIIARTLRFNTQYLMLNDHAFDNAYIGQLVITHQDTYGRMNFESDGSVFYGTTITNLYFKLIDFAVPISEVSFSNSIIHTFTIKSSKFYGFKNQNRDTIAKSPIKLKHDHFLEYDVLLPYNQKKLPQQSPESHDESSSIEAEQTITMNIATQHTPLHVTIFTIISSINTMNLTENYFPNNLEYSQAVEIELSSNQIISLDAHVFRHLKQFQGRLILKNNQIQYLHPYALTDLSYLKNLSLSDNFIHDLLPMHFKDLTQLHELDLSSNQIHQLNNDTFKYLQNLHTLYLNNNPLEIIHSDAFTNLNNLKQIHFRGVNFIHLVDSWIWNLANRNVIHLLKTDFDLSDVAFCILSQYNHTSFHLSHQHFCSCNIHYFNFNQNFTKSTSILNSNDDYYYLRLTPMCNENQTELIMKPQINEKSVVFYGIEERCDYQLMFLDCDAMTATTEMLLTSTAETTSSVEWDTKLMLTTMNSTFQTVETSRLETTTSASDNILVQDEPIDDFKKLFAVLGVVAAVTISVIGSVIFWYRVTTILKQKKKTKQFIDQQRHFNTPVLDKDQSIATHYASSDTLGSIQSIHLSDSKSYSEVTVEPIASKSMMFYKNIEDTESDRIANFIDDESLKDDTLNNSSITIQTISRS